MRRSNKETSFLATLFLGRDDVFKFEKKTDEIDCPLHLIHSIGTLSKERYLKGLINKISLLSNEKEEVNAEIDSFDRSYCYPDKSLYSTWKKVGI